MKRNKSKKIFTKRLEKYEVIAHNITEDNVKYDDTWKCIYEHIEVFTDRGTPLIAFKFCNYGEIVSFDRTKDLTTSRVFLLPNHEHFKHIINKVNAQFNAHQNCLGFCILDGEYWLNLTKENIDLVLKEDKYEEVDKSCTEDHLVIYYDKETPVHIAKYNSNTNKYESKVGCNTIVSEEMSCAKTVYTYDKIVRFKKQK